MSTHSQSREHELSALATDRDAHDTSSPSAIIAASYAAISGSAGKPRDWARFRRLYAPGARLMPVRLADAGGRLEVLDVEQYIASRAPWLAERDFYETEVSHRVDEFGPVVHVWSTYETRSALGTPPTTRGVNSIQLVRQAGRWWIVSVLWQSMVEIGE